MTIFDAAATLHRFSALVLTDNQSSGKIDASRSSQSIVHASTLARLRGQSIIAMFVQVYVVGN